MDHPSGSIVRAPCGYRHKGDRKHRLFGNGSGVVLGSEHGRVPVADGIIRRHWSPHFGVFDRLPCPTKNSGFWGNVSLKSNADDIGRVPGDRKAAHQTPGGCRDGLRSVNHLIACWPASVMRMCATVDLALATLIVSRRAVRAHRRLNRIHSQCGIHDRTMSRCSSCAALGDKQRPLGAAPP